MGKNSRQKRPRRDYIYATTKGEVSHLTVRYDPAQDRVTIADADPDTVRLETRYVRPSSGKEKVVSSIAAPSLGASFSTFMALKDRFDYLIAIDTNTKKIGDHQLSICATYLIEQPLKSYVSEVPFVAGPCYAILDVNEAVNPERLGWHLVIKNHFRAPPNVRIGVIVDCELGEHLGINSRAIPYYEGHLLPENVSLIYASDASSDSLVNQMIRYCDKLAARAISEISGKMDDLMNARSRDDNCAAYAYFSPKKTNQ